MFYFRLAAYDDIALTGDVPDHVAHGYSISVREDIQFKDLNSSVQVQHALYTYIVSTGLIKGSYPRIFITL